MKKRFPPVEARRLPEGLEFVPAVRSPSKTPLLIVGNDTSGTTTIFEIQLR